MENFVFYSPTKFLFGKGEAAQAGPQIAAFGGSKVLLVYGGGSVKRNGSYDDVTASLKAAGIPWTELSGIQANPRSGKVYEGIDIVRREHVDFLLALAAAPSSIPPRPSVWEPSMTGTSGISSPAKPL